MNERARILRECLVKFLNKEQGACFDFAHVEKLLSCGVIPEEQAVRFVVRCEYYEMMWDTKANMSMRDAVIYLSARWSVSETTVKNIVYKYKHLKVA